MGTKCPECYTENPDISFFCADCGTQLIPSDEISVSQTKTLQPDKSDEKLERIGNYMKKCLYCAEGIQDEAIKCRYCGEWLKEDIPDLVNHFLKKIDRKLRKNVKKVSPEAIEILMEFPWKGNIRKLENALTRAVILSKGDVILAENLPNDIGEKRIFPTELVPLRKIEKKYIQHVLNATEGNKTRASQILQITRPTLDKKIKDYKLSV